MRGRRFLSFGSSDTKEWLLQELRWLPGELESKVLVDESASGGVLGRCTLNGRSRTLFRCRLFSRSRSSRLRRGRSLIGGRSGPGRRLSLRSSLRGGRRLCADHNLSGTGRLSTGRSLMDVRTLLRSKEESFRDVPSVVRVRASSVSRMRNSSIEVRYSARGSLSRRRKSLVGGRTLSVA